MFSNKKIIVFRALAETLSYTKTAKQLYMSQQAVSRHITTLEDELDAQLFVRTTRSVELTPAGRKYYDLYNKLNYEYDEAVSHIREEIGDERRRIRLGMQSYMMSDPIFAVQNILKNTAPDLALRIDAAPPSIMLDQFNRGIIDMLIILSRFLPDDEIATPYKVLMENKLYLMVSADNPKATDDASYKDLMYLPYLTDMLEGEDNISHNARMQRELNRWELSPDEVRWTYDRDSALMLTELGYGIVIDADRQRMIDGRKLKKYDTGKYEQLLMLYSEEMAEDPDALLVIEAFEEVYREVVKVLRENPQD